MCRLRPSIKLAVGQMPEFLDLKFKLAQKFSHLLFQKSR